MITLKVTKNQGFTLSSLEDTLFEKPQLQGGREVKLKRINAKVSRTKNQCLNLKKYNGKAVYQDKVFEDLKTSTHAWPKNLYSLILSLLKWLLVS